MQFIFLQVPPYSGWSYLWVFLCIPKNFPGSCGWNFPLSTRTWFGFNRILCLNTADWNSQFLGHLFIPLSCSIKFNYLFSEILWQLLCFPHDSKSINVSAARDERCRGLSEAQKLTDLLYTTTHLEANRSRVRMVTFGSHSNWSVWTCVHVIRPKSPGYVNFWSGSVVWQ